MLLISLMFVCKKKPCIENYLLGSSGGESRPRDSRAAKALHEIKIKNIYGEECISEWLVE